VSECIKGAILYVACIKGAILYVACIKGAILYVAVTPKRLKLQSKITTLEIILPSLEAHACRRVADAERPRAQRYTRSNATQSCTCVFVARVESITISGDPVCCRLLASMAAAAGYVCVPICVISGNLGRRKGQWAESTWEMMNHTRTKKKSYDNFKREPTAYVSSVSIRVMLLP